MGEIIVEILKFIVETIFKFFSEVLFEGFFMIIFRNFAKFLLSLSFVLIVELLIHYLNMSIFLVYFIRILVLVSLYFFVRKSKDTIFKIIVLGLYIACIVLMFFLKKSI